MVEEKAVKATRELKLSTILRWAGPAGIGFGVFLVFSAMSGMPMDIPFVTAPNDGFELVSSGLVLWAMVMLLVGMAGLYARNTHPDAPKVVAWDEAEPDEDLERELRELVEAGQDTGR